MVTTRRSTRAAAATEATPAKVDSAVNISGQDLGSQRSPYTVFLYIPNLIGKIPHLLNS
jgi:hypothetical protein